MPKGWIYEPFISYNDLLLFYNAVGQNKDPYYYKPIAIAKREETGIKYRFLCIGNPRVSDEPASYLTNIEIYKPEKGMPYTTKIHRVRTDELFN